MRSLVDNLSKAWVHVGVKNVFTNVDNFNEALPKPTKEWNTLLYTRVSTQLSIAVVHVFKLLLTTATLWFIPRIHRAYYNQYKENLINTSNKRRVA